jgi:hypothetical protein
VRRLDLKNYPRRRVNKSAVCLPISAGINSSGIVSMRSRRFPVLSASKSSARAKVQRDILAISPGSS